MPIIVHVTTTFQICMKVQSDIGLVEISKRNSLITNVLFHVKTIDNYMIFFYFHLFHVVDEQKVYEEAMEDLHKTNVHLLNNEFI
jgi:hypothetical protein